MTTYADTYDLAAFLHVEVSALSSESDRMLERAQELIESATVGRIDTTDVAQMESVRKATCAQVEFWLSVGEDRDVSGPVEEYSASKVTIKNGSGSSRVNPTYLAPRAQRILFNAGLLYRGASMGVGNAYPGFDA